MAGRTRCCVRCRGGAAAQTGGRRAMGWTDERVELLKKLWLDGLSASQIAKQLGGVTRNAVIGKVHRLGLSGRADAVAARAAPTFKAPRPPRPISMPAPSAPRRLAEPRAARPPPAPGALCRRGAGHGDGADAGRPHVQVADRRSGERRLHLLRPPRRRRRPLLHEHAQVAYQPPQARRSAPARRTGPVACAATSDPPPLAAYRSVGDGGASGPRRFSARRAGRVLFLI